MRNITELVHEYLEAKRHIWNTYFRRKVTSLNECSPLDQFEEIDRLLFKALVTNELSSANIDPAKYLKVKAREGLNLLQLSISEPIKDNNRVWNKSDYFQIQEDSSFEFIDFFDWTPYGFTTYPYVKVKIDGRSKLPDFIGREALI